MTDSDNAQPNTRESRDHLLGRFENLTFKIEAALDHDDVAEVAFLLSKREEVLKELQHLAGSFPLSAEQITKLQERDVRLQKRLEVAQAGLNAEAGSARVKGKAARTYVKNS
jgi:hypothetical protein